MSEFDPEIQWRLYLSGLPSYLDSRIRGQSAATGKIARAVQAAELGLNDSGKRPKCSFLFLGPTGVGKTESAKRFTEYLFGSKVSLEMIFMNEYSSESRLSEFLGRTERWVQVVSTERQTQAEERGQQCPEEHDEEGGVDW